MFQLELLMLAGSILLLLGILASKVSSHLGVPAMVLFLAVGMLAGSEGPGGIHFDDPRLVQAFRSVQHQSDAVCQRLADSMWFAS